MLCYAEIMLGTVQRGVVGKVSTMQKVQGLKDGVILEAAGIHRWVLNQEGMFQVGLPRSQL